MQGAHCMQGMVFAINAPPSGEKSFENYKNNAMGKGKGKDTSTVVATCTTSTTTSVYAPPPPPPPPPTMATMMPGTNVGKDGQCQCVCNIDIGNGAPNGLQGVGAL